MLHRALRSLVGQETDGSFSYEILVIDDASTDDTRSRVREVSLCSETPIRYSLGEGKGIACARNKGLKESFSEWVAFFDDDQLAEPAWLEELLACAREAKAECVGGRRLLDLSEDELTRLSPTCRNILGEVDLGKKQRKCWRKEYPAAGNILLRRKIFDAVGGFDESFGRGGEDTELAQRMRRVGIIAWYAPAAVAWHMIPTYRLRAEYLVWASQRAGDNFAYRDYLEWGLFRTTLACTARIGQAILITMPILIWGWLKADDTRLLGQKCLLWRTAGYAVHTLHLLMPRLFNPERFFGRLEFRKERRIFSTSSNAPERAMEKS